MKKFPKLSAIVAVSRNGAIGLKGGLPWRLSSDLKLFKAYTLGKPVLMGRKTWESLPFPLPGRPNLVLSRNKDYYTPSAEVFTSLKDMVGRGFEIAGEQDLEEVMLIGGATLYERLIDHVDRLYASEVHADIKGDAFFPQLEEEDWEMVHEERVFRGLNDDYDFTFRIYDRRD